MVVAGLAGLGNVRRPRRLLTGAVVVALFVGVVGAGVTAVNQAAPRAAGLASSRIDTSRTPPPSWWVVMGTTVKKTGVATRYGAYDSHLVGVTIRMTREQSDRYSRALLADRLHRLGVSGAAGLAATKWAWNWGDGMFWAYGEGHDSAAVVPRHGPITPWVASWNSPRGAGYPERAALTQALWLLVLAVAGLGLLVRRYRRDLALVAFSVLGIGLLTVLIQGRSRYLLVYVPLVVAIAFGGPPWDWSRRRETRDVARLTRHNRRRQAAPSPEKTVPV